MSSKWYFNYPCLIVAEYIFVFFWWIIGICTHFKREDSFEISGLLTANEFKELFTTLFRSAAVDDAFLVLINALHSCDSSQMFRLQHIIILLDDLEKTRLESLLADSIEKDPNDGQHLLICYFSLLISSSFLLRFIIAYMYRQSYLVMHFKNLQNFHKRSTMSQAYLIH